MLIRQNVLERIRDGEVALAFRRWRRPTVSAGGTVKTAVGVLAVDAVERVPLRRITAKDARLAGYKTLAELTSFLTGRDGDVYRVSLRFVGDDPRGSLRESLPSPDEGERSGVARAREASVQGGRAQAQGTGAHREPRSGLPAVPARPGGCWSATDFLI